MSRSRRRGRVVRQRPAKPRTAVRVCSAPCLRRDLRPRRSPLDGTRSRASWLSNGVRTRRMRPDWRVRRRAESSRGRMETASDVRHAAEFAGTPSRVPAQSVSRAVNVRSVSVGTPARARSAPGDGRAARRHDAHLSTCRCRSLRGAARPRRPAGMVQALTDAGTERSTSEAVSATLLRSRGMATQASARNITARIAPRSRRH